MFMGYHRAQMAGLRAILNYENNSRVVITNLTQCEFARPLCLESMPISFTLPLAEVWHVQTKVILAIKQIFAFTFVSELVAR